MIPPQDQAEALTHVGLSARVGTALTAGATPISMDL